MQPFPTEQTIHATGKPADELWNVVTSTLELLDIRLDIEADTKTVLGFAKANVWSRAARRKRARENGDPGLKDAEMKQVDNIDKSESDVETDREAALGFKIKTSTESVYIRWLEGMESKLFESFVGMLHRAIHPR